ncbi:fibronectin type III domain-containing protein [Nonomuraea typhae]|uniref:Fibronectin type III domain-containing protein n=1 Tax=Nonomuraea typhae TaxID=2603600 RepID=A0ABW7YPE6_9ACTN
MPDIISIGVPAGYAIRLVAYAPNGDRLGLLPHPLKQEAAFVLNDLPGLRFDYSSRAVGAELLDSPVEMAVEHYNPAAGTWAEGADARFLLLKKAGQRSDATGVTSYTCPGYGWQMKKAVLYAGGVMAEGKRQFGAVTPGEILRTFLDEAHARGTIRGLTTSFTLTHDSDGKKWAKQLTIQVEPGVDTLAMLINLSEQGVIDWCMRGRVLHVYNEGTVLAHDLSVGGSVVDLRLGRDIVEAPDDATLEDLASAIMIRGEAGLTIEVTNPSAATPWGRWETHQAQGGVSDSQTATLLGQTALERAARERVQITRAIVMDVARWLPHVHYQPGNTVLAPDQDARMQPLRIRQITLTSDGQGQLAGNVVLNDRFLEADIKLARRQAGILAGGVGSGGNGSDPAPEPGGRTPAAPTGVVIHGDAYIDGNGFPQGLITATWLPVTKDVNGVAIDVTSYELYSRENGPGGVWRQIAVVDGSDTTATFSPLRVRLEYAFKVRAVAG